ncbi:MAG: glycosyltransferase family 2 protein [Clostridiales bacterium]|nr:glycosyltransferase family 2 protein [Clostridiales bacterium]
MVPISVCIITKNEEKNLAKCLAPLTPYGFEIIVVDTGSTDRTREIALQYTDKVYDFQWVDDFSAARNFSIQKASHNYILVLDSDEFLTQIDIEGVYQAIEAHPRAVGLLLRNSYYDSQGTPNKYTDRVERLFHRQYYTYKFPIHEQVTEIASDNTIYERYDLPLAVEHVGYNGSPEELKQKALRNNALLFREIEKDPSNAYLYFQVGQSFNMIKDYENAYHYYQKAFSLPLIPEQEWVQAMAISYINAMTHTGRAGEAIAFFQPYYQDFATSASFFNSMGVAYLNASQPLKAMLEFVKAIQCPVVNDEGSNTYLPYYNIGLANEMLGNVPDAIQFYRKCGDYSLAQERLRALGIQ